MLLSFLTDFNFAVSGKLADRKNNDQYIQVSEFGQQF